MGNSDGKLSAKDEGILRECANKSKLTFEELKAEYDLWQEKHPSGSVEKKDFLNILTRIIPNYSKDDLKAAANHVFRVFDNDNNGKITFEEFMLVYNILAFGEIEEVLGRMFLIFDVELNGTISKREMRRVIKDLSVLYGGIIENHESENVFDEMDENKDDRITKEEFVKSIQEGNRYGQNLAARLVLLYNARK